MKLISITVLAVLLTVAAANTDEWNLLNNGESFLHDLVREKRQDASQNATEVADDDILNFILDSGRQGRSLEGFDEVYSDPSVQQALQNSDDVEARNIIKEKLCALGLMQCDGELIDGRRPYLNPQNLIYAQPVALRPVGRPIATVPIQGPQRPGPPPPSPQYIPKPPQPQPPQRPHQGPYGPPQPMPPPRPQQKVGFASHQPSYNRPNSFTGSSSYGGLYSSQSGSFSPYPSKPLGPIYEGGEIPYEFENPNKALIIGDGAPLVKPPVEQHIHHHYHHIEGGDKTAIASNPVPLSQGVLTESAVGGSSLTNSNLYSSSVYGSSGVPNGGFNPSASKDFDYQDLKGSSNTGYNQYSGYASQSKPVNPNVYNRGPATFASTDNIIYGSNPTGSGASGSSNSFNSGYQSSQGAYHTSNPNLYKKELNVNGLGTNQNSFATNYNKYSQQSNINSQYSHNQLGANSFGSQGAQYGGANPRVEECVCVPYEQCPAQDVVGRRDDLILPLDPRNFKTDIEADIERVVVTDGNGTMTVVHVSKNHTAQARSANVTEPVKKISKREAAANKKSDNDDDKAKVEPNIPTPAPGHSEGSNIVSFPRSRRATDISVPDQLEPVQSNVVSAVSEEPAESGVQEKSFSAEKRQAYYGPQPQQCPQRTVCCRRPAYRPPPTHAKLGQCGVRNAQGINGRIKNPVYVDGDSEFGEYPWQVAILKKDPKESVYVCGGTLIDNQYIITAAHCVKTYNGFDLRVRLGEWDVNHDVEFYPYIERDVISVQVHPEYYAGTLDNDLAILKMDSPVDFSNTPHISPACLPDKYTDFSGQRCWTTGWGKDAFGDYGKYQNILKEVDVPIVNDQQCQAQLRQTRLGYQYKLHPGFVCAGGEEGKDACKGDGGGPLVCERNGSWQVVGVVSWGIGCGKANVPGVYVKVAYYLDWLQQVRGRY
ncbi:serine protease filzig-like isoform X4 [Wyeomyia smithii]|uniref:serine protease filzig-like isoform X4 n=1 Tax=Wyeomyia smithii TaxID=174621 RepID=UPI002468116B|nr:serine protease filzig-like isoform X4 [Wyeomyia smithii]